tara:strand:- start:313 stop:579 length:267 start_codon:yes stop_codon:yes gene_type:complete
MDENSTIKDFLNWTEYVDDELSHLRSSIEQLDRGISQLEEDGIDNVQKLMSYIKNMIEYFSWELMWKNNDNDSKKMLSKWFNDTGRYI